MFAEDPAAAGRETPVTVPGYALPGQSRPDRAVVSPGALAKAGFGSRPGGVIASTTRMPTEAEENRLRGAVADIDLRHSVTVERGGDRGRDNPTAWLLALAAGVITLGAAGIATGLAAADSRADLATLAAVGASPAVRRRLSLSQSGVITGVGSVLGAVAGFATAAAALTAINHSPGYASQGNPYPIAVPWLNLAVALLVVPAVGMLGAGLLTRSRLPVERRL